MALHWSPPCKMTLTLSGSWSFGLSTKRTQVWILCPCETLGKFFTLYCSSSLSWIEELLAIDIGGYLYKQPLCINCSVAGCFSEKLRWCLIEQVCQGVKCKALWTVRGMDTAMYKNLPLPLHRIGWGNMPSKLKLLMTFYINFLWKLHIPLNPK